jgi:hypothetical protein
VHIIYVYLLDYCMTPLPAAHWNMFVPQPGRDPFDLPHHSCLDEKKKNAFDLPTTPHFSHNFFLELCLLFIDLILLLVLFWIWTLYIYFYMCIIASQWLENSIYLRAHTTYEVILVSSAGWVPRFLQKATTQGAGNAKLNPERGQPSSWECLSIQ